MKNFFAPSAWRLGGAVRRAATALLLCVLTMTVQTAWAETETINVSYIDADGQQKSVTATVLTGSETSLGIFGTTTWYVVNSNISHNGEISSYGDVNIILADGKKMTTSNNDGNGINGDGGTLTIYGQNNGTGTLEVNTYSADYSISSQNVVICGGTINVNGEYCGVGIKGYSVTINGGTVTVSNVFIGILAEVEEGAVTINGGTVTAIGDDGIMSLGTITLGWTNATDRIKVNSFDGGVTIANGKALKDASGNVYCGTLSDTQKSAIANVTLQPASQAEYTAALPFASWSGSGTEADPYKITSASDLEKLRDFVNNGTNYYNKYFKQTADITLSGSWTPIGSDEYHSFSGTFNGDSKTISGINISSSGDNKGLFGFVGQSQKPGIIQNLTLANSTITGANYVGGIVGNLLNGTVSNCHVLSSVSILASSDNSLYFGGIVGRTYPQRTNTNATIENCTSAALVTNNGHNNCSNFGGIVGYNYYYSDTYFSKVTGCFYYGTAVSASSEAGAIVGLNYKADGTGISNCYYNYPSTISGIGYGNTDNGTTRVYTVTCTTSGLSTTGTATYTHNGTHYFAAGATFTVTLGAADKTITSLSAASGTISNVSIAPDGQSATFTVGSSDVTDVTVSATLKALSGTTEDGLTWSLGGTNYTELTIGGTGPMQAYGYTTGNIWKTKAPWGTDITKVTIGNGVTSIGDYAFMGCENLASITIGSGVTSIGIGAINHCDKMTTVTLPASVTTIAYAAFENCQMLQTIYINHDGEVSLTGNNDNAFNAPNLQYIIFPSPVGALANTKDSGNWARYSDKLRAQLGNQLFFATNEGGTAAYKIATETDLRNLSTAINGGANGSGQAFRQTAKISVSGNFTPIGSSQTNYFGGTYDGGDKTLTVDISDTQNQGTALFRNIQGATIKNLLLSGTVTGTIHAAALVGFSRGTNTIDRCKVASNVTVTTPSGTNYHCGGLVGHALTSNLTISNTVYCGTITNSGNFVGGLQGWCDNGNTISITNCLFAGSYQGTATGTASFHPIAVRGKNSAATVTATNTYYEVIPSLGDYQYIAADGKKATAATSAPSNLGSLVETLSYMTIYQNGILFNGKYYAAPVLSTDNSGAYIINSAANWTAFCDMLYDNLTYNRFTGKTVKLGADITVSRMAGVDYHDFCGTFDGGTTDGGRHTLTFTATATDNYLAPFCNVLGNSSDEHAVIRNLKVVTNITADDYRHTAGLMAKAWGYVDVNNCDVTVNITSTKGSNNTDLYPAGITSQVTSGTQLTVSGCTVGGTIESNGKYAAGYVGILQGSASIQNSVSSVNIQSSTSGDGIHGGFVAVVNNGQSLTIEGCLFNGKIVTTNGTTNCGGFVGHDKGTGVTITNSLYAPTTDDNTVSEGCATFGRNVADENITNCYYTAALGTAQGTKVYSISKGENVTTLEINGTATQSYDVSGLSFYDTGIKCGDVLYAVENAQLSLTLGCTPPAGYTCTGYTATAGNLNGTTLTMPNENVTINVTLEELPEVSYIDENGTTHTTNNYTIISDNSATTFGQYDNVERWYVVTGTVNFASTIEFRSNSNIIIADGAVLNVGTAENPVSDHGIKTSSSSADLKIYAESGTTGHVSVYSASNSNWRAIYGDGGELVIVNCEVNASGSVGIYDTRTGINIVGCQLNLAGGNGVKSTTGPVTLKNTTLTAPSLTEKVIYSPVDLTLDNCTVVAATSATHVHAIESYGGTNGIIIKNNSNINVETTTNLNSNGIFSQMGVSIEGSTVEAKGNRGIVAGGAVTITDATVKATSGSSAIWAGSSITLDGSDVTAKATSNSAIYAENGNITIRNNGKTIAESPNNATNGCFAICTYQGGNVIIESGSVEATGYMGIFAENVNISGGQVSATGSGYGILAWNGSITLGWTNASDYIHANSYLAYGGTLSIAAGKTFADEDGNTYSGTIEKENDAYAIDGKTLLPYIEGSVPYIDENGERQLCTDYTIISDNTVTTFGQYDNVERWYVVTGTVNFASTIEFMSNSNIIIADGAVLNVGTAENPVSGYLGGIFSHFDLKIYAESGTTGHVSVYSDSDRNAIFDDGGELVIVNCEVNASGSVGIYDTRTGINIVGCQLNLAGENGVKSATGPVTLKNTTLTAPSLTEKVIYSPVDLTLDNCTVVAATSADYANAIASNGGTNGIIIKNNSNINVKTTTNGNSNGIFSQMGVSIEGSTVEATGSRGIYAGGNITLDGSDVTAKSTGAHAIYANNGNITIRNNGKTVAESPNNATNGCYAIIADYGHDVIIEGGTVEATGSRGIYAGGNVSISNAEVSATGGTGAGIMADNSITLDSSNVTAKSTGYHAIYAYSGNITIRNNGKTVAESPNSSQRFAIGTMNSGNVIIEGGTVEATGSRGIFAENVNISGGQVSATGSGYGILAWNGNITLGWTNASDYIHANSYLAYGGTLAIAEGKAFINAEGDIYESGTVNASDINGKTLRPYSNSMLFLADDADNTAIISKFNGQTYNVTLAGRKLWKDGYWNTLVLPFAIANIEADGCPLKGATVRELSEAYVTGTTLTLNFDAATTEIAAGVPYIVKWDGGTEGEYTENPVFQGVTIDATPHSYDNQAGGDTNVRFIGTYDQKTVNTEDQSILFLGAANTLYYPSGQSATTIGACRAYFKIGSGTALARQLTAFNLNFADGESQGIVDNKRETITNNHWYTLDGVRLDAQPTRKGLYIHGGRKVVIK